MHYIRKLLLVVLIKSGFFPAVHAQNNSLINGTIIITLVSNDTIWVAADSRTSALTDKGFTVNKKGMCKIYSTNNVVCAMAGHVRFPDNSFNFAETMKSCIIQEPNFEKSMELFRQRARKEINSILKKFSRKSVNTLIKTNNGSFLSVVSISFINDEKKITEMKFSIDNSRKVIDKVTDEIGVGSLRFLGHAATASEYVKNNQLFFGNGRNIPDRMIDLIQLESTKGSSTVGLPADVISIYNNGFKRVISSGLCR